jgi:hypothetical protein
VIQPYRHELLDRMLVWNQRHLMHALREYERHYNVHRPTGNLERKTPTTTAGSDTRLGHDHALPSVDVTVPAASSTSMNMPRDCTDEISGTRSVGAGTASGDGGTGRREARDRATERVKGVRPAGAKRLVVRALLPGRAC